jgi:hypothetical protein
MIASHDIRQAEAFANLVASTPKSAAAFLEFAKTEAAEILTAHKSSVEAIAVALLEKGTLDAEQIDNCIAAAEAQDALQAEKARRLQWTETIASAVQNSLDFGRRQKRIDALTSLERDFFWNLLACSEKPLAWRHFRVSSTSVERQLKSVQTCKVGDPTMDRS